MKFLNWLYKVIKELINYIKLALSDNGEPSSKRLISFISFVVFVYVILAAVKTNQYLPEYYIITLAALIGGVQLLTKNLLKK